MKKFLKWLVIVILVLACGGVIMYFFMPQPESDIKVDSGIPRVTITSSAFVDNGAFPEKYTGHGSDTSPGFDIADLDPRVVTLAVIMDDIDIPMRPNYTHWVIWNIPASSTIPEGISPGESVSDLGGAIQGVGFGRHQYKGPLPPFGNHRYQFHVFALDTTLDLDPMNGKTALLTAMDGHILQYGMITGWYPEVGA